ncbi:MAG: hypothetical protein MI750_16455 [Xanthomonadales bacterium]|jgi:hypothetical protein|nr:hypothetical protein [Xanthomonadales bacterium]
MQRNNAIKFGIFAAALLTSGLALAQPYGYAVNSDGFRVPDEQIDNLYRINLSTGEAEPIGATGYLDIEGLSFSAEGTLMGADDESNSLLEIDLFSGAGRAVGGFNGNLLLPAPQVLDFGLSFTCHSLYASSDNLSTLYEVDHETGKATLIGNTAVPITGLAAWGNKLFGIGAGELAPSLYSINPETAETNFIGPLGDAARPYVDAGLAFDEDGQLWAITDRRNVGGESFPSQILMINIETGEATDIAETLFGIEAVAIAPPGGCDPTGPTLPPEPVPALRPSMLAATAFGLLSFGLMRLRRRR